MKRPERKRHKVQLLELFEIYIGLALDFIIRLVLSITHQSSIIRILHTTLTNKSSLPCNQVKARLVQIGMSQVVSRRTMCPVNST